MDIKKESTRADGEMAVQKRDSFTSTDLKSSLWEVVGDLIGNEKLPEAHTIAELNRLLNLD
ncbi:hypothetical protein M3M39_03930 [Fructilactobacillus hinvesii]|uniref:Uncharacterized protein n=1 Tax=Fructilactobacillus hinvesii TaxID=2940300 RepID=A0ABY5BQ83_9LACO|nr:hypothetical protein [Fructilactobacillus hinvesii]USS87279.1 hypothetical protein M3M39_03930 [Fructilactobacillus hinvesii]